MTIFESILLLAVTACVIITAFGVLVIKKMLKEIVENQYVNGETLSNIRGDTIDIIQELNNIEDNNDQGFKALTGIVDKMFDRACLQARTIKVKGRRCELTDEELMKRINEEVKED